MRCHHCERELAASERVQPMTFHDRKHWPRALCDSCARANQTRPGSHDALVRLGTARIDPEEAANVLTATSSWLADMHETIGTVLA